MALSKDDILGAKDSALHRIDIPEWGGEAFVRILPGTDLDALTAAQAKLGGAASTSPSRLAAEVVGRCLCDSEGNRIFKDDDIGALAGKSGMVLNRVASAALAINGLTDEAYEAIKGN